MGESGRQYTDRAVPACNRADRDKLQPQSHLQSHPRSHCSLSRSWIPLTKAHTHEPPLGSGKGSGERRGATHPKTSGFRPRQVFLRHTRRAGSLPSKSSLAGRPTPPPRPRRTCRDPPPSESAPHGGGSHHRATLSLLIAGHGSRRRFTGRHPCSIATDSTRSSSGSSA